MAKKGLLNQYLLQLQHHPLRTKVSLNKTTHNFCSFFLVIWVRLKFWFCLIFRLTHVWLLRNEEEIEETWKFESFPLFFFSGFGIIWHEHSAESGKKSNLIFLYIYCAESELYICIFNGYKLGFTFSLRLISVQFVI